MKLSIQEIYDDNLKFWGSQRRKLLENIWPILSEHGRISQEQLDDFIIKHKSANSREWLKGLEAVLTCLKDCHGVDTVIPPLPITLPRPSNPAYPFEPPVNVP